MKLVKKVIIGLVVISSVLSAREYKSINLACQMTYLRIGQYETGSVQELQKTNTIPTIYTRKNGPVEIRLTRNGKRAKLEILNKNFIASFPNDAIINYDNNNFQKFTFKSNIGQYYKFWELMNYGNGLSDFSLVISEQKNDTVDNRPVNFTINYRCNVHQ